MTKEIYISSTPHETRLAVVEDDLLAEIYYERENEYTLAGSIYKGKVTRVLPGMQSAFVDIGLERDAFLYVTDFAEEQEDGEEYVSLAPGSRGQARVSNGQSNGNAAPKLNPSPPVKIPPPVRLAKEGRQRIRPPAKVLQHPPTRRAKKMARVDAVGADVAVVAAVAEVPVVPAAVIGRLPMASQ